MGTLNPNSLTRTLRDGVNGFANRISAPKDSQYDELFLGVLVRVHL